MIPAHVCEGANMISKFAMGNIFVKLELEMATKSAEIRIKNHKTLKRKSHKTTKYELGRTTTHVI